MVTETTVHKKYRILKDAINDVWDRISFWTKSTDVYLSSGTNLETDLSTKDTKISANQVNLGVVQNGNTATQAFTKGQIVVWKNKTYRVIAAIASGNTFKVGTNIEAVTISTLSSMLVASNGTQFYFDYKDGKYGFYPNASKTASQFIAIT